VVHVTDVAVAILTYRRPDLLVPAVRGVLGELNGLSIPGYVIVVDNDPEQSAREVVQAIGTDAVRYVPEPEPGIPAARNTALDAAAESRLIVFMDDDETPDPGWLQALVDTWTTWKCDGVAGPNIRRLTVTDDPWIAASRFFEPADRPDGTTVAGAPTSNLLLDLDTVRRFGLRFDRRFDTTGGSDTLFTRQLTARGGEIRWSRRAVTSEPVPPERATRDWVLARERRLGNTWSRVHLVLAEGSTSGRLATMARLLMLTAKLLATGALRFVIGKATGNLGRRAFGERHIARARGLLMGLRGERVEEYRRN
jgi:glycosyltransferase involved in cell wall biosynthesis